ncbi:hypothetical protein D047_4681A, partial [Vibrio parahaemolyticus VPTS-2010_2]
MKKRQR